MSNPNVTAAMNEFDGVLGTLLLATTTAERERCAQVAFNNQHLDAQFVGQKILKGAEPEPPQPSDDEAIRKAIEAERQRNMEIARTTRFDVCAPNKLPLFIAQRIERADITGGVEPPAPEPMTVAKVLAKIRAGYPIWEDWDDCERDLVRLVQDQARRDAAIIDESLQPLKDAAPEISGHQEGAIAWLQPCRDKILKAAGLE